MKTLMIKHVKVDALHESWRAGIARPAHMPVTVHIEVAEAPVLVDHVNWARDTLAPDVFVTDDPTFGRWADRKDMADVSAYVRRMRAGRPSAQWPTGTWTVPMAAATIAVSTNEVGTNEAGAVFSAAAASFQGHNL